MNKTYLLIDGDQFLFKAAIACERETRWDEQNHVLYSNENQVWDTLTGMLERIFERFETRTCTVCFSAPPNFRNTIEPSYKAGRSPRKPLCYALVRERIEAECVCQSSPGLEADDVMGILATKPDPNCEFVIVSQDKDMKTIPTTVWNGKDLVTYTEAEADYWHMYQTLTGDTSDGYPGCPGVGPKKAEALLKDATALPGCGRYAEFPQDAGPWCWWKLVINAYTKAGLTEEDALKQARLARILRWSDWNSKKKEPVLWSP